MNHDIDGLGWDDTDFEDFDSNPELDLNKKINNINKDTLATAKTTTTTTTTSTSSFNSNKNHRRQLSFNQLLDSVSNSLPFQLDIINTPNKASPNSTTTNSLNNSNNMIDNSSSNNNNNNNFNFNYNSKESSQPQTPVQQSINKMFNSSNSLDEVMQSPPFKFQSELNGLSSSSSQHGNGIGSDVLNQKEVINVIEKYKKENFDLKCRIFYMNQSLTMSNEEKNIFQQNVDLKVELDEAKKELEDRNSMVVKLSKLVDSLKEKVEKHKQKEEKLKNDLDEVTKAIENDNSNNNNNSNKDKDRNNSKSHQQPPQQQQVVIQYTKDPEDKDKIQQQHLLIDQLNDRISQYDDQIRDLKHQINSTNQDIVNQRNHYEKYQSQLEDSLDKLKSVEQELLDRNSDLLNQNQHLKDQLEQASSDLGDLSLKENEKIDQLLKELKNTKSKLETLKGHYEKLKGHYEQLKEHYQNVIDQVDPLRDRVIELENILLEKDREIETIIQQNDFNIVQMNSDHQDLLASKVKEITELRNQIKRIREEFYASSLQQENSAALQETYRRDVETLQIEINHLHHINQELENQLASKLKTITDYENHFSHLEGIHYKTMQDIDQKVKDLKSISERHKKHQEQYNELEAELIIQKNRYKDLTESYSTLEYSNQELQQRVEELLEKQKEVTRELIEQDNKYKEDIKLLSSNYTQQLERQLETKNEKNESIIKEMKQHYRQLENKSMSNLSNKLIDILKSLTALSNGNNSQTELNQLIQDKVLNVINGGGAGDGTIDESILNSLEELINIKIEEFKQFNQHQRQSIKRMDNELKQRFDQFQLLIEEKSKNIDLLEMKLNQFRNEMVQQKSFNEKFEEERFNNQLKLYQMENQQAILNYKQQIEHYKQQIDQYQHQISEQYNHNQQYQKYSNDQKQKYEKLQKEFLSFKDQHQKVLDNLSSQYQLDLQKQHYQHDQQIKNLLNQQKQEYFNNNNNNNNNSNNSNNSNNNNNNSNSGNLIGNKRNLDDIQMISISDLDSSNKKQHQQTQQQIKDKEWIEATLEDLKKLENENKKLNDDIKKVDSEIKSRKSSIPPTTKQDKMMIQKQPRYSQLPLNNALIKDQINQLSKLLKSTQNQKLEISNDFLSSILNNIKELRNHNRLLSYEFDSRSNKYKNLIDTFSQYQQQVKDKLKSSSSSSSTVATTGGSSRLNQSTITKSSTSLSSNSSQSPATGNSRIPNQVIQGSKSMYIPSSTNQINNNSSGMVSSNSSSTTTTTTTIISDQPQAPINNSKSVNNKPSKNNINNRIPESFQIKDNNNVKTETRLKIDTITQNLTELFEQLDNNK